MHFVLSKELVHCLCSAYDKMVLSSRQTRDLYYGKVSHGNFRLSQSTLNSILSPSMGLLLFLLILPFVIWYTCKVSFYTLRITLLPIISSVRFLSDIQNVSQSLRSIEIISFCQALIATFFSFLYFYLFYS